MRTQYRYRWHIKDFNPSKTFQEQTPTAGLTQCSEYKINGHHPAAKSLPFCGKNFVEWVKARGACHCICYMLYVDSVYFSLGVLAQQTCKHTVSNVVVQRTWRAYMTWRHTCIRKIRRELLNAQLRHWILWWKKDQLVRRVLEKSTRPSEIIRKIPVNPIHGPCDSMAMPMQHKHVS